MRASSCCTAARSSPTEPPPQPGGKAVKFEDDPRSSFRVADYDLMSLSNFVWYVFIFLVCVPCVLGMAYCALLIYGAVQVQNLESRKWGFASAISQDICTDTIPAA